MNNDLKIAQEATLEDIYKIAQKISKSMSDKQKQKIINIKG